MSLIFINPRGDDHQGMKLGFGVGEIRKQMVPSCLNCEFRESGCLKRQPDEVVAKFSDLLVRYTVKGKGKTIFNQGDAPRGVDFLCRGMLKSIRVSAEGGETIQDLLIPCSIIGGVHSTKPDHVRISSFITVSERTDIAVLNSGDVLPIFQNFPELGIGLTEHLSPNYAKPIR